MPGFGDGGVLIQVTGHIVVRSSYSKPRPEDTKGAAFVLLQSLPTYLPLQGGIVARK